MRAGSIGVGRAARRHPRRDGRGAVDHRAPLRGQGNAPVGYYDLSVAGIPVHSTAFRPIDAASFAKNPFRVFTSLLRLDLVEDAALRAEAGAILARRRIFTARALELTRAFEEKGGLTEIEAEEFVRKALATFRWHSKSTVDADTYSRLADAQP